MENNKSCGITFGGALQVALIVLKLCKVISWSWWIVLLPFELGLVFFVIALIILIVL